MQPPPNGTGIINEINGKLIVDLSTTQYVKWQEAFAESRMIPDMITWVLTPKQADTETSLPTHIVDKLWYYFRKNNAECIAKYGSIPQIYEADAELNDDLLSFYRHQKFEKIFLDFIHLDTPDCTSDVFVSFIWESGRIYSIKIVSKRDKIPYKFLTYKFSPSQPFTVMTEIRRKLSFADQLQEILTVAYSLYDA